MTTAAIDFGPDVLAAIGHRRASELRAATTVYTCAACGRHGDARLTATSAVLISAPLLGHLRFAHASCAEPFVAIVPSSEMPVPETTAVTPRAIGLPQPGGVGLCPLLLLAIEQQVTIQDSHTPDALVDTLIADGLYRWPTLLVLPPISAQWSATLGPDDRAEVRGPTCTPLENGRVYTPPAWRTAVRLTGTVTLIVGLIDHDVMHSHAPPLDRLTDDLRTRRAVAGRISVNLR